MNAEFFQIINILVFALFVFKSSGQVSEDKGDKKQVIMLHPKPHQSGKLSDTVFFVMK